MNFKMKTKMVSHLAQLTNQGDKKAKDNKEEDLLKNLKHRREEFKKQTSTNENKDSYRFEDSNIDLRNKAVENTSINFQESINDDIIVESQTLAHSDNKINSTSSVPVPYECPTQIQKDLPHIYEITSKKESSFDTLPVDSAVRPKKGDMTPKSTISDSEDKLDIIEAEGLIKIYSGGKIIAEMLKENIDGLPKDTVHSNSDRKKINTDEELNYEITEYLQQNEAIKENLVDDENQDYIQEIKHVQKRDTFNNFHEYNYSGTFPQPQLMHQESSKNLHNISIDSHPDEIFKKLQERLKKENSKYKTGLRHSAGETLNSNKKAEEIKSNTLGSLETKIRNNNFLDNNLNFQHTNNIINTTNMNNSNTCNLLTNTGNNSVLYKNNLVNFSPSNTGNNFSNTMSNFKSSHSQPANKKIKLTVKLNKNKENQLPEDHDKLINSLLRGGNFSMSSKNGKNKKNVGSFNNNKNSNFTSKNKELTQVHSQNTNSVLAVEVEEFPISLNTHENFEKNNFEMQNFVTVERETSPISPNSQAMRSQPPSSNLVTASKYPNSNFYTIPTVKNQLKMASGTNFNYVDKDIKLNNLSDKNAFTYNTYSSPSIDARHGNFDKYDVQKINYELSKQYTKNKIDSNEKFMQRMMFDIFKRQTKDKRINNIIEKNKVKINEDERVNAFNRLIEDANRRMEASEKMEYLKNDLEDYEIKNNNLLVKSGDTTTKFVDSEEWDKIYHERFINKKKEKEDILQKKIIEKEKNAKVEEDKIIEKIQNSVKKAPKGTVDQICKRMYDEGHKRRIMKERKVQEVEIMLGKQLMNSQFTKKNKKEIDFKVHSDLKKPTQSYLAKLRKKSVEKALSNGSSKSPYKQSTTVLKTKNTKKETFLLTNKIEGATKPKKILKPAYTQRLFNNLASKVTENMFSLSYCHMDDASNNNNNILSCLSNETRQKDTTSSSGYNSNSKICNSNTYIVSTLISPKHQLKLNNEFVSYDPNERHHKSSKNIYSTRIKEHNGANFVAQKFMPELAASNLVDNVLKQRLKYQI